MLNFGSFSLHSCNIPERRDPLLLVNNVLTLITLTLVTHNQIKLINPLLNYFYFYILMKMGCYAAGCMLISRERSCKNSFACATDEHRSSVLCPIVMIIFECCLVYMARTSTLNQLPGRCSTVHPHDMLQQIVWPHSCYVTHGTMPPLHEGYTSSNRSSL